MTAFFSETGFGDVGLVGNTVRNQCSLILFYLSKQFVYFIDHSICNVLANTRLFGQSVGCYLFGTIKIQEPLYICLVQILTMPLLFIH